MFICTGWGCSAWSTADRRRGCSSPAQHFTIIIYNMNFTRALGLCSHHTGGMADVIDRPRFWHPFPQMSQGFVPPRRCRHCSCCPRRRQIDKKQHSENMLGLADVVQMTPIQPKSILVLSPSDRDSAEPANLVNPGSDTVIVDASTAHRVADGTRGVANNLFKREGDCCHGAWEIFWKEFGCAECIRFQSFSTTSDTTDIFWPLELYRSWHPRNLQYSQSLT